MTLTFVAWRNLSRRPFRSLLTLLGIAVAVTAVVALVGVAESLQSSFLSLYDRRGADLVIQRRGGAVQISKGLPAKLGPQIREIPEAGEVIAGLMDMIAFEDAGLFMVLVNGWDVDCPVLDRVTLTAGRRLEAGDRQSVMLGRILADNLGARVGDSIEIYAQPFHVVGVFESFSVFESGAVFMLMEDLQREMDRPGQVTGFVVESRPHGDPRAIESLRRQIEKLNPDAAAVPCAEFVAGLDQIRVARTMSWIISAVAAFLAAAGVLNTMVIGVLERRGEIAALRAIGWSGRRVMRMIFTEAAILATAGITLGMFGGAAAVLTLAHWKTTSNLVSGDLSLQACGEAAALALLMTFLSAAYPAYRAAAAAPAAAMHR